MHTEDKSAMSPILTGHSHIMNICSEADTDAVILITTWQLEHRITKTIRVTGFPWEVILTTQEQYKPPYSNYF